ncbi:hypothetical protein AB0M48_38425 [Lentzea sp. NPDC051208]|uniref:hypothetical protein n=1 Tax=Lentzea sp. NPDC051208 TaxID=3154642 RepID=UPI003448606B
MRDNTGRLTLRLRAGDSGDSGAMGGATTRPAYEPWACAGRTTHVDRAWSGCPHTVGSGQPKGRTPLRETADTRFGTGESPDVDVDRIRDSVVVELGEHHQTRKVPILPASPVDRGEKVDSRKLCSLFR